MWKLNIFMIGALAGLVVGVYLMPHKPVCDDLVRYPADNSHELVCESGLGNITEDDANVRIR